MVPKTPIEEALTGPGLKEVAVPSGTVQVGGGRTGLGGCQEAVVGAAGSSALSAVSVSVDGGAVASVDGGVGVAAAIDDVEEEEPLDYEEDGVESDASADGSGDEMDTAGDSAVVDRQLFFDSQVVVAFHTLPHSSFPYLCLALVWHPGGHREYVIIEDRTSVEYLQRGFGKVLRRRRPLFLLDDGVEAGALESWAGETREFASWGRLPSPLSSSSSFENPAVIDVTYCLFCPVCLWLIIPLNSSF